MSNSNSQTLYVIDVARLGAGAAGWADQFLDSPLMKMRKYSEAAPQWRPRARRHGHCEAANARTCTLEEHQNGQKADVVLLRAADFARAVRLTRAGHYRLTENVCFQPTATPTDADKPVHSRGWVCALSIEHDDVDLDLGGHTMQQSDSHARSMRFFTTVLIGRAFFRSATQGPFNMGGSECVRRVSIHDGQFGQSSHFHIFSPCCADVKIVDLRCQNFEVAAVQLNSANDILVKNLLVGPNRAPVELGSAFTHAQLLLAAIANEPSAPQVEPLVFSDGAVVEFASALQTIRDVISAILTNIQLGVWPFRGVADSDRDWLEEKGQAVNGNLYGIAINGHELLGGPVLSNSHPLGRNVKITNCNIFDLRSELHIWPLAVSSNGTVVKTPSKALPHLRVDEQGRVLLSPLTHLQAMWMRHQAQPTDAHVRAFVDAVLHGTSEVAATNKSDFLLAGTLQEVEGDCMFHGPKGTAGIVLKGLDEPVVRDITLTSLQQIAPLHGPSGVVNGASTSGVLLIHTKGALLQNVTASHLVSRHGQALRVAITAGSTVA